MGLLFVMSGTIFTGYRNSAMDTSKFEGRFHSLFASLTFTKGWQIDFKQNLLPWTCKWKPGRKREGGSEESEKEKKEGKTEERK